LLEYLIVDENPKAYISLAPGETIIVLTLGSVYSVALTSSGRVFTWGDNDSGQLGNNTIIGQLTPARITPIFKLEENEKIIQVVACDSHSAALTSQGRAFLWGSNYHGEIGSGDDCVARYLIPYELKVKKVNMFHKSFVFFDYSITILQPIKEGYTFSGRYLDKEFQHPFSLTKVPADDVMSNGRWLPESYNFNKKKQLVK
jgi:hypothetical protein